MITETTKSGFDMAMDLVKEYSEEKLKYYGLYIDHSSVRSHLTGTILGIIQMSELSDSSKRMLLSSLKEAYKYGGIEMSEYITKTVAKLENEKWNQIP
jgi:hypothetical protein